MKNISITLICFIGLIMPQVFYAQDTKDLRYEILLSENMLDSDMKKLHFIPKLEISSDRHIILSSGYQFYVLGWAGMVAIGSKSDIPINSYAFTSDSVLMAVKNDQLFFLNKKGILESLVKLPTNDMYIFSGKDVLYLTDNETRGNQYHLYAYAKGGRYKQLFVSPKPINNVVELYDSVYLTIGSGIYSFSPTDNKLNLIAALDKEMNIQSLTADTTNNILYFSSMDEIYAYQNGSIILVSKEFKGVLLQFFGDGLIIFNPNTHDIVRIVHINNSLKF